MSKEVFKIEGLKLGLTLKEIKSAIKNVEDLSHKAIGYMIDQSKTNDFIERGLHQIKTMWENNPDDILHFKRNFKHRKRVMNRQRI